MANDFYAPRKLSRQTLARAETVNAEFASVQRGFDQLPNRDKLNEGRVNYLVDEGEIDAMAVYPDPPLSRYVEGLGITLRIAHTNTGPCSLNVSDLGPRAVKRTDGSDLVPGALVEGFIADVRYTGTLFALMSPTKIDLAAGEAVDRAQDAQGAAETAADGAGQARDAAIAARDAAIQTAGVTLWVGGAAYVAGDAVFSPRTFETYRAKRSHVGINLDPSKDKTNWASIGIAEDRLRDAEDLSFWLKG